VRRAAAPDAELVKRARGRLDGDGSPAASAKQTTAGLDAFLAKDMRAWADLCAEDVLVEFPFAPAGTPSRLDGRVAIFEYLRNYPKIIDVHEIGSLEIYPTDRPDTVIGEWSAKGHVIPNGNAYNMSYATFVTVRDGSIVNYREYWNPLALAQALGDVSF
jgi:ketosteroid isomerase-like protein